MAEPDYIYDPDDWEATFQWSDRQFLTEDIRLYPGDLKRFETLLKGPDKWAACVVVTVDEDGCPDETEIRWFDSEEDAKAAAIAALKARRT